MAKMTKAQRSSAARKAARTRKRNASKGTPRKRRYSISAASPKRRTKRRTLRAKNNLKSKAFNIGAGLLGGGLYLGTSFVYKPAGVTGKVIKTLAGTIVLGFFNGSAAAGYAGAGMLDIATKMGMSLGARGRRANFVNGKALKACGNDSMGRPVLKDNKGNIWAMNERGQYQLSQQPASPYQSAYNQSYYPSY